MRSGYTSADLFMGVGGATLSLQNQGFDTVAAIDIDANACETYQKNFGLEPICGDINKITGHDILDHYGLERGSISILTGCPPCQGFSSLRRTRYPDEEDDRKGLIRVFADRIREIDPKAVIFENVPGIIREKGRPFFDKYLSELEKMGFKTSWDLFNTADFGVPQKRKRVVAISIKGIKEEPSLPDKTHTNPNSKNDELRPWRTVRDAIGDLPKLEPGDSCPDVLNHVARNHAPRIIDLISLIPKDGGSRKSLPDEYWLECHKNLKNKKGAENIYGRLWWDKPAGTMTCRCTTPSSGRFLHPDQNRAITPREAARFQTFPDDFEFHEALVHAERQIGNAVPVKFMDAFVSIVKDYL